MTGTNLPDDARHIELQIFNALYDFPPHLAGRGTRNDGGVVAVSPGEYETYSPIRLTDAVSGATIKGNGVVIRCRHPGAVFECIPPAYDVVIEGFMMVAPSMRLWAEGRG